MKISLAQIDIYWEDKETNKARCETFISKASEQAVELILFPEMSLTGFSMNANILGEDGLGETVLWFKDKAIKYNICVGFGYIYSPSSNTKAQNKYIVIDSQGSILSSYSKLHPFSFGKEAQFYEGGSEISLFNLNQWIISTFICYDLRFPEIFQIASKSAALIAVAANWPEVRIGHWEILLKARAIENQCYIAGVNRVGIGDGIKYSGHSMIIDPLGRVIAQGNDKEDLLICEINIENVNTIRKEFKLKADRKEELYNHLTKLGDD